MEKQFVLYISLIIADLNKHGTDMSTKPNPAKVKDDDYYQIKSASLFKSSAGYTHCQFFDYYAHTVECYAHFCFGKFQNFQVGNPGTIPLGSPSLRRSPGGTARGSVVSAIGDRRTEINNLMLLYYCFTFLLLKMESVAMHVSIS